MKRTLFLFMPAFVMIAFAASCGNTEEATDETSEDTAVEPEVEAKPVADYTLGAELYAGKGTCATCHQAGGEGMTGSFPPLSNSDYLKSASKEDLIKQTLYGSTTPITVNGTEYPGGVMGASVAATDLSDQEVVEIINYMLNSWGNDLGTVSAEDVAAQRVE